MRILLVEDTLDVGEAIVARFERIGHTVDWEKDGGVADEVLEVQAYDLLILDVNLPALDGFSILKRLRQRKIEDAGPRADGTITGRRPCRCLGSRGGRLPGKAFRLP